jgi:hypothetical protein
LRQPLAAHHCSKHRAPALVRRLTGRAGQLQHADAAQSSLDPLADLFSIGIDLRASRPLGGLPINGLGQDPSDSRPTVAKLFGDLALAPAALVQKLDQAPFHLP